MAFSNEFASWGLFAECEVVIPELWDAEKNTAAVMDLVVSAPGGITRYLIDVRTVDGRCAHGFSTQAAALADAAAGKHRRYGPAVWPFVMELRGQTHFDACLVLECLAGEAAQLPGAASAQVLLRSWRHALECTLAFESAEACRFSQRGAT